MPTYTYACSACAHRFDTTQSIHDDALTECPECGAAVRRVISAVGVSFKGSGFYRTDTRAAAKAASKSASSATSPPSTPAPAPPAAAASSAPKGTTPAS